MKKQLFILLLALLAISCGCKTIDGGGIATIEETLYLIEEKYGEQVLSPVLIVEYNYNDKGDKIKTIKFDNEGNFDGEKLITFHKHNDKGYVVEETLYTPFVLSPYLTHIYEYNDKGEVVQESIYENWKKTHYSLKGTLKQTNHYTYNDKGEKTETLINYGEKYLQNYLKIISSLTFKMEYLYKNNGETVKELGYNSNGEVVHQYTYKYDNKNRVIEMSNDSKNGATVKYEYNDKGEQQKEFGYGYTLENKCNERGDVVEQIYIDNNGDKGLFYVYSYEYNDNKVTKKTEKNYSLDCLVKYEYNDKKQKIKKILYDDSEIVSFSEYKYNDKGEIEKELAYNDEGELKEVRVYSNYKYDEKNNWIERNMLYNNKYKGLFKRKITYR